MTAPLCDVDPEHGAMQAEHIYNLDGSVDTDFGLYWFCQAPDCDGYGGPVAKHVKPKEAGEQMQLFAEQESK